MVKEIELQNGMVALVDDEDFERVNQHVWSYAITKGHPKIVANIKNKIVKLKHFILFSESKVIVRQINKNELDFRRCNLITHSKRLSRFNKARRNGSSKYKGVGVNKKSKRWIAQINLGYEVKNLGSFENEDDAAIAYNEYASFYFGECYLNVIGECNRSKPKEKINTTTQIRRSKGKKSTYKGVKVNVMDFEVTVFKDKQRYYLGRFKK